MFLLQDGNLLEGLLLAEATAKRPATGCGAGSSSPSVVCLLMQAKAHALGGAPLNALPHALSAMALCQSNSLLWADAQLKPQRSNRSAPPPHHLRRRSTTNCSLIRAGAKAVRRRAFK